MHVKRKINKGALLIRRELHKSLEKTQDFALFQSYIRSVNKGARTHSSHKFKYKLKPKNQLYRKWEEKKRKKEKSETLKGKQNTRDCFKRQTSSTIIPHQDTKESSVSFLFMCLILCSVAGWCQCQDPWASPLIPCDPSTYSALGACSHQHVHEYLGCYHL